MSTSTSIRLAGLLLTLIGEMHVHGQRIDWLEHTTGWNNISVQTDMVVDKYGNTILACEYAGDQVTVFGTPLQGDGTQDGFVAKLDPSGQVIWVVLFTSADTDHINDLAVDTAGNLYLDVLSAGFSTTFTAHNTVISRPSVGQRSLVIKLSPNGEVLTWRLSDHDMVLDCAWGDVFAYYGTVPGEMYLERMDGQLQTIWLDTLGTLKLAPVDIKVDTAGYIAMAGLEFTGDTMELQGVTVPNDSMDQNEGIVARFDLTGTLHWVRSFGAMNAAKERVRSISIGPSGSIYVGTGSDTAFVFAGESFPPIQGMSSKIAFLLAFDEQGNEDWAVPAYSHNTIPGFYATMVDRDGNVLAAAQQYQNGVIHGQTVPGFAYPLALIKCSPAGDLIWLKQAVSGPNYLYMPVYDIGQGPDGAYYLGGFGRDFYLDCSYDPTSLANSYYVTRIVDEPVVMPQAGFTYVMNGPEVQFTDTSLNTSAWSWDFDDGTDTTMQSPMHEYLADGTYYVTLTASLGVCTDTFTDTITLIGTDLLGVENVMPVVQLITSTGALSITDLGREAVTIEVIDGAGRRVCAMRLPAGGTLLQQLDAGAYHVVAIESSGRSTQRIVVL